VPAGTKVVRMVPPLVINRREVKELLARLERTLELLNA
jgi:acetylornithine aminotransferase